MIGLSLFGGAKRTPARVTEIGELVTAPFAYDVSKFNTLGTDGAAVNFYPPISGKQFVIKGMVIFADKDVSDADDTVIVVYEATSSTETTVDKIILQFGMGRLTVLALLPLNLLVREGKFINAKTGDDDMHLNIMGHYIPALAA